MKLLKYFLLTLGIIIVIPLILALFVKKTYEVEREVIINRPKEEVFDYLKYLKNQDEFSKWASMDPSMKKSYKGTDASPGFISAWESDNPQVGKGEQEIIQIKEGERIDYELRFQEPFESRSNAYIITTADSPERTSVKWGFTGKMDYPMNLMLLFMDFEKMIGNDFETGLNQLKSILEK
jgi:uncharacterized protein YndB with AHSA1/START domain